MSSDPEKRVSKRLRVADGKIYFTRTAERKFFFVLTMLMLVAGIMFRLGIF
ncbi:MAG: hypothetical protein K9K62_04760 [Desulfobacteraceae bacterium]|nr:hypothetical protein [Desulfobacteraceae bacterium]MCF8036165.1 hypothetical protein [Desulfobacteraceae bacterium]